MMKNIWNLTCVLALTLGFANLARADQVGNGGDVVVADFVNQAGLAVQSAKYYYPVSAPVNLVQLETLHKTMRVESTDNALAVSGVPKDAINYPAIGLVVVNRSRWLAISDPVLKRTLALHEMLGLLQVDDSTYSLSWALLHPSASPVPAPGGKNADLLLVIDNSGSMYERQLRFAGSLKRLIDPLIQAHVNLNVAMITADEANHGKFYPVGSFLSSAVNPVDLAQDLQDRILKLGTAGSGEEKPLLQLMESVAPSNLLSFNAGFFRSNANLEVLVVTDAPDQSGSQPAAVLAALKSVKSGPGVSVRIHGLTDKTGCSSETLPAADPLLQIIKLSSGLSLDLCEPKLDAGLENLANDILTRL